jgi:hypothetical protein
MSDSFFIAKNESIFDEALNPKAFTDAYPEVYGPRFDAIKEMRDADDGTLYKGSAFRHVASFVNLPMFKAAQLLDPEFMQDKSKFYAFLRRNREYATYDIKSHTMAPRYTSTVVDGKVI